MNEGVLNLFLDVKTNKMDRFLNEDEMELKGEVLIEEKLEVGFPLFESNFFYFYF